MCKRISAGINLPKAPDWYLDPDMVAIPRLRSDVSNTGMSVLDARQRRTRRHIDVPYADMLGLAWFALGYKGNIVTDNATMLVPVYQTVFHALEAITEYGATQYGIFMATDMKPIRVMDMGAAADMHDLWCDLAVALGWEIVRNAPGWGLVGRKNGPEMSIPRWPTDEVAAAELLGLHGGTYRTDGMVTTITTPTMTSSMRGAMPAEIICRFVLERLQEDA